MSNERNATPSEDLDRIIQSATRLGVEMDEEEALQWLAAIAVARSGQKVVVDVESGVFGHRVSMLDFDPADLDYFRQVGQLVEFTEEPGVVEGASRILGQLERIGIGEQPMSLIISENLLIGAHLRLCDITRLKSWTHPVVETALALSGSAAQSKIQSYPGDLDFFERVNIKAPSRQEACTILSRIMRDKALATFEGETYRLIEVKYGSYPYDIVKDGQSIKPEAPIAWKPDELRAGRIEASRPDGTLATVTWDEVADDPGWCKLDWVVADPVRDQVANASNMLDVTWEAPDGSITPLDGYLDPYFQEVYLEAESIPIFSKLVRHMSENALDDYVAQLEGEVEKYLTKDINYGKAAKRMYNIFRLTGRYQDAAFLRELFDEPTTMLYQVWTLIRTIDEASEPGSTISVEAILAQTDQLILAVIEVLEGDKESEIVRHLLRLHDSVAAGGERPMQSERVEAARAEVINIVNNFFYERLTAIPSIKSYIDSVQSPASADQ